MSSLPCSSSCRTGGHAIWWTVDADSEEDAVALLHRIVEGPEDAHGAHHILISVPIVDSPQGEVDGNPHEAHLHQWDADDMDQVLAGLGGNVETFRGGTLGCWWWSRG